jgi:Na+-driven multidrug efflux pump
MIREIVFGVGFALLLPRFFGLDGVLYSMPVSDILTAVVSAIIIAHTYKQLDTGKEPAAQKKEAMVNPV